MLVYWLPRSEWWTSATSAPGRRWPSAIFKASSTSVVRDAAHLRPRDAQPKRPDQLIRPPRRDAAGVRLLHHRHERLLGALARLQERREVAAPPELRDLQLDLAGARVPPPRPVAIAVGGAIIRPALVELGADQLRHLRLHQLLDHPTQRLADHVAVLLCKTASRPPRSPSCPYRPPAVPPSRRTPASPTMVSAAGPEPHSGPKSRRPKAQDLGTAYTASHSPASHGIPSDRVLHHVTGRNPSGCVSSV